MPNENPLIVQSNNTLLLEVNSPLFADARDTICVFAHLEKSPEHVHTYGITPLSLWNAASLGIDADWIIGGLTKYTRYPLPENVVQDIRELIGRFGLFALKKTDAGLVLGCTRPSLLASFVRHPRIEPSVQGMLDEGTALIHPASRGVLKQAMIALGYPVNDCAGYVDGEPYPFALRTNTLEGKPFAVRPYQALAGDGFCGNRVVPGGSGVIVLPCGAGKTIVGIHIMARLGVKTLILVTNITAARQWKREIVDKTTIPPSDIAEYSGEVKEIGPITIATYQIVTWRREKNGPFEHFGIFQSQNWGLVLYDEVHLLPAPVFKITADLQARRRLGLTATLIREDGRECDVFTLIGPKKYDVPWKELERQGWIATVRCTEIRVEMSAQVRSTLFTLEPRQQIRIAYENPAKYDVLEALLQLHRGDRVLIIGQYLSQLQEVARRFRLPLIAGATPNAERDRLYDLFRKGGVSTLVLSKVGNFAIDLPDATVAIQLSGAFGSRQEEAQRLGRILRPKKEGEQAAFYSIVTRESRELDFAMKRQLFLVEQGYSYGIRYWENGAVSR